MLDPKSSEESNAPRRTFYGGVTLPLSGHGGGQAFSAVSQCLFC
jgi:hypothetical protein